LTPAVDCRGPLSELLRTSSDAPVSSRKLTTRQSKSPSCPCENGLRTTKRCWKNGSWAQTRSQRHSRSVQVLISIIHALLTMCSYFAQDYKEYHTNSSVRFVISMSEAEMKKAEEEGLEKRFRMTTTISTSNMVAFDLNGKIRKYSTPEEILEEFYHKRLEYYGIRKVSRGR
jgi:hypothetical protein